MLIQKSNKKNGFTLLELVVAMVITSILSLVMLSGVSAVLKGLQLASTSISLMSDINLFTAQFERDVKNVSINNANSQYIPQITSFNNNGFSFIDNTGATITYALVGHTIERNGSSIFNNEIDPAQTQFSFFGYSGGAQVNAISANQIRLVTFTFVVVTPRQNYRIVQTYALNYR
ncbi:MAG: prepilin-type N-terminal cleavage/methylation domain-containing protein, partial [Calditrichia bacterium]|nr:prepilin-type N-terminal cleavage/methylation domain-containing protein [Calditrichia bacterium]